MDPLEDLRRWAEGANSLVKDQIEEIREKLDRHGKHLDALLLAQELRPDSEVWLAALLCITQACPDVLPAYAAERADEVVKLYRSRFPAVPNTAP